jgi:hypothetical protein
VAISDPATQEITSLHSRRQRRVGRSGFARHRSGSQEKNVNEGFDCSHAVRLSGRQWFVVILVVLTGMGLAPGLWRQAERFDPGVDYRIPYDLSNDYWLYDRYAERVTRDDRIAVVGDSVIWGHYVSPNQTLTHHLNELAGNDRFANLGLDGTHPAAVAGLLKHYAKALSGRSVVLHFNPLWITSEKHDLQTTKEFRFNHPKLVPQFAAEIPCYRASFSTRLWAVIERGVPFYGWTCHLRAAYFDNSPPQIWTLEHPYANPLPVPDTFTSRISNPQSPVPNPPPEQAIADYGPGANLQSAIPNPQSPMTTRRQSVAWVALDNSLQWRFFRRSIGLLRERRADVFVIVGPFNEHALTDEARAALARIKIDIGRWLTANEVPHAIPSPLPAEHYVDTSHPTAEGYALLAQRLADDALLPRMLR